ncbi:MAG: DMT family transporter [Arcobacteraceae bacterium]|jgi:drug/metabolite transporter (DMT)-like permease|nr:DMT family transporter [Arcobacteraceae bacterium]
MSFFKPQRVMFFFVTALALLFLSANSVLCKLAFFNQGIDPFSFSAIRLISGAITLLLCVSLFSKTSFSWHNYAIKKTQFISSGLLFLYAIAFSYSYVLIDTGVGALILFGTVQIAMIAYALLTKQNVGVFKIIGGGIALFGLGYLLLPTSSSSVSLKGALLMALAGLAWAFYSIIGKNTQHPLLSTSYNFSYSVLFVILFALISFPQIHLSAQSFLYAIISGSLTSGIGYVLWYMVVTKIETSTASIIQLIVPVLATVGGVVLLDEALTWHIVIASTIILSGIALLALQKEKR